MNRGIITISETGVVIVPTAPIWMTKFEIADMFGVFSYDIRKAIRAIYKNKELNQCDISGNPMVSVMMCIILK